LQAKQVGQGVLVDHLPMVGAAAPGGLLDIGADDEPCDPRAIASGRQRSRRANHAHSAVRQETSSRCWRWSEPRRWSWAGRIADLPLFRRLCLSGRVQISPAELALVVSAVLSIQRRPYPSRTVVSNWLARSPQAVAASLET
jgi:hypothetical protein